MNSALSIATVAPPSAARERRWLCGMGHDRFSFAPFLSERKEDIEQTGS